MATATARGDLCAPNITVLACVFVEVNVSELDRLNEYLVGLDERKGDPELDRLRAENAALRSALELIATPKRPDGTYNRSREACEVLARESLEKLDKAQR